MKTLLAVIFLLSLVSCDDSHTKQERLNQEVNQAEIEVEEIEKQLKQDPSNEQIKQEMEKAKQALLEKTQELEKTKKALLESQTKTVISTEPEKFYILEIEATGNRNMSKVDIIANNKKINLQDVKWNCVLLSAIDFKTLSISVTYNSDPYPDRRSSKQWSCSNAESSNPCIKKIDNIYVNLYLHATQHRNDRSVTGYMYMINELNPVIKTKATQLPDQALCKKLNR